MPTVPYAVHRSFRVMMIIFTGGVAVGVVLAVPDWPFFRRHPVKWRVEPFFDVYVLTLRFCSETIINTKYYNIFPEAMVSPTLPGCQTLSRRRIRPREAGLLRREAPLAQLFSAILATKRLSFGAAQRWHGMGAAMPQELTRGPALSPQDAAAATKPEAAAAAAAAATTTAGGSSGKLEARDVKKDKQPAAKKCEAMRCDAMR